MVEFRLYTQQLKEADQRLEAFAREAPLHSRQVFARKTPRSLPWYYARIIYLGGSGAENTTRRAAGLI